MNKIPNNKQLKILTGGLAAVFLALAVFLAGRMYQNSGCLSETSAQIMPSETSAVILQETSAAILPETSGKDPSFPEISGEFSGDSFISRAASAGLKAAGTPEKKPEGSEQGAEASEITAVAGSREGKENSGGRETAEGSDNIEGPGNSRGRETSGGSENSVGPGNSGGRETFGGSENSEERENSWKTESPNITETAEITEASTEASADHVHRFEPLTEIIHHDAVIESIHVPAVTEEIWVVDAPAWDETVEKTAWHWVCDGCQAVMDEWTEEEISSHMRDHALCGESVSSGERLITEGTETVHHEESGHFESRIIAEERDEPVVILEAWDEVRSIGRRCSICGIIQY